MSYVFNPFTNNFDAIGLTQSTVKETLGTKLRRLSTVAQRNNPFIKPPMKTLMPWQPSTNYAGYLSVVNGGNIYVNTGGGTSPYTSASSGGPTATGSSTITDNLTQWLYYGQNFVTDDPQAVIIPWTPNTSVSLWGSVPQYYLAGNLVYACAAAGITGATAPTGTSNAVTDGTVTWTYMGVYAPNPNTDFPVVTNTSTIPSGQSNHYFCANIVIQAALRAVVVAAGASYAVNDYLYLSGGTFYTTFTVSGITTTPTYNSTYTNNSVTFTVVSTNITAGSGTITCSAAGIPTASGTLSKSAGTGDSSISFSAAASQRATFQVTSVSSGGVTGLTLISGGKYLSLAALTNWTTTTSGSGSGCTLNVAFTDPPWCVLSGGAVGGNDSNQTAFILSFQQAPNISSTYLHWTQEFISDSPIVTIAFGGSAGGTAVLIDSGQGWTRYSQDTQQNLPNNTYWNFAFPAGRKPRRFKIVSNGSAQIPGILVDPGSSVWAPDTTDRITVASISDSIWAGSGYGPFSAGNNVTAVMAHELGWYNWWDFSVGGTGYVNAGTDTIFGWRIPQALAINPQIWVLMGSTNDEGQTVASITAAALLVFQTIRASSNAPIVVFGCWPTGTTALTVSEAGVSAAIAAFTDPLNLTFYIPLYNRTSDYPMLTASFNNQPLPSGYSFSNANNELQYVGAGGGGTHPVDPGTVYEGMFLANLIRRYVLPNIN